MASTSSQPSTSSILHPPHWVHDVFLSFRGLDTRNNFIAHLYNALIQRGIKAYKDDNELERGRTIEHELWKAIEESMFSIVVFSKDYTSSPWCLDELVKITHCMKTRGQTVLPIFYDVDPSDVADQNGSYEMAFIGYEIEFNHNQEKVKIWKEALSDAANLSGWDVRNKDESKIIKEIVNRVWREVSQTLSIADKGLVGMDFHLKEMNNLLQEDRLMDVLFIGICGMGGVGKTTIATAVYDMIHWQYEFCCFLSNVKEAFNSHDGVVLLQKQILSKLNGKQDIILSDARSGAAEIRKCLKSKKILIILDDVDDLKQLELLAGERSWFGSGSRLIITSRDSHLLSTHGVDGVYKVDMLNEYESLVLFCYKAFKQHQPSEKFLELSKRVLAHANGLPLALSVLGCFLHGRSMNVWQNAIDKLHKTSHNGIMDVLRISFDNLEESQKQIFLDIACFFNGKDKKWVANILDECGFYAHIGIDVLIEKSLLSISKEKLQMHELLQVMGRRIVNEECLNEPGGRSRLWDPQEIRRVLENNTGNEAMEVIFFNEYVNVQWNMESFSKMKNLRILKLRQSYNACKAGPTYLSQELRFIDWNAYPSSSLPFSFQPNKLVELYLHSGEIKQLWSGYKVLNCLKTLDLFGCNNLEETPDFTAIPNLEKLILSHCQKLSKLHPSFKNLKKLVELLLDGCTNLKQLASSIEIKSLLILNLDGCLKLKKFPTIGGSMPHLHELHLKGTKLKTLPDSMHNLTSLVSLKLQLCRRLQNLPKGYTNIRQLPKSISQLKSLKLLDLSGCSHLKELTEDICELESLEYLDLRNSGIRQLPKSIFTMSNLKELKLKHTILLLPPLFSMFSLQVLHLDFCNLREEMFPDDIGYLSKLTRLSLKGNNFVSLPRSISQLSMLLELYLANCGMLRSLPEIPPNVEYLSTNGCTALEEIPDLVKLRNPNDLTFHCSNCIKLYEKNGGDHISYKMIQQYVKGLSNPRPGFDIIIPGRKIPKWFINQSKEWSITIPIPIDFLDSNTTSKWMGVVGCVSFRVPYFDDFHMQCSIFAIIDSEDVQLDRWPSFYLSREYNSAKLDHFWSFYLSINHFKKWKDKPISHLRLSFLPGRGIFKRCGARLVSCEDMESSEDDEHSGYLTRFANYLLDKVDLV